MTPNRLPSVLQLLMVTSFAASSALASLPKLQLGEEVKLLVQLQTELERIVGDDPSAAVRNLQKEALAQIVDVSSKGEERGQTAAAAATGRGVSVGLSPERVSDSTATPVIQMHGMGDYANDEHGMVPLAEAISDYLGGAYVLNVQIGRNDIADILNGFIMNLDDQVDYFADVVRGDENLQQGFNAVGYSQGNLVIRGYIEKYNNPPVFNFISMHGPLAGVGSFPGCPISSQFCRAFSEILGKLAYKPLIQQHLAQANYFRDPMKIPDYLEGDLFLADINNERGADALNSSYTANWESLQSVCLVKALKDSVVVPNDSEWYGYFQDGSFDDLWGFEETPWYTQDLFGLKTLNEVFKNVYFNTTEGDHLDFSTDYLLDLVGLYFV